MAAGTQQEKEVPVVYTGGEGVAGAQQEKEVPVVYRGGEWVGGCWRTAREGGACSL